MNLKGLNLQKKYSSWKGRSGKISFLLTKECSVNVGLKVGNLSGKAHVKSLCASLKNLRTGVMV